MIDTCVDRTLKVTIFETALGWCGFSWAEQFPLTRLTFGHADFGQTAEQLQTRGNRRPSGDVDMVCDLQLLDADSLDPDSWPGDLVRRLVRFATGSVDDFRDIPLPLHQRTRFERAVIEQCRLIPYGQTLTYGQLAERAGASRAARAVGNVMRTNRFPLIVPCHRVVGAGGSLGGYSAPAGLDMKRRLLELERRTS